MATLPRPLLQIVATVLQQRLKIPALDVASGLISVDEAVSRGLSSLLESHANASFAGRALNGVSHGVDDSDRALGRITALMESQYFESFLKQVSDGKYTKDDGSLDEAAIERRSGLYTLRLRGTANESWALSVPDGEKIHWRLGDTEDSCSICPDLAQQGPYKPHELPTNPGANETPCLFNCKCYLQSTGGTEGFKCFALHLAGFSPTHVKSDPLIDIDPFASLRKSPRFLGSCSCCKKPTLFPFL